MIKLSELKTKTHDELLKLAEKLKLEDNLPDNTEDLRFAIQKELAKQGEETYGGGVLEVLPDQYGFLRSPNRSYMVSPNDIYVSAGVIRRFGLRKGDSVYGKTRKPGDRERYFALTQIEQINGQAVPKDAKNFKIQRANFDNLTPLFPEERLTLQRADGSTKDLSMRITDMMAPIGKGQRALIVSPPKAGKTMLMQNIAESISANHAECELFVLLIDERPEEVTDMRRSVKGEVVASTFDEPPSRHVQVAEMVLAKAKRLVEQKKDVIILLDSITRLARAYNTMTPSSGKVLTGGVDANALQRPKRFFGAARNVEEGGSLTIIATALVETGSKMDEVIYEEFKGTGNMELHLKRSIAQKHIYPAIDVTASGTRREDLITSEDELKNLWVLRKYLQSMEDSAAIEFLVDKLKSTKTNDAFFKAMKGKQ